MLLGATEAAKIDFGNVLTLSPEEFVHSLVFAVAECISEDAPADEFIQWQRTILSVPCTFKHLDTVTDSQTTSGKGPPLRRSRSRHRSRSRRRSRSTGAHAAACIARTGAVSQILIIIHGIVEASYLVSRRLHGFSQ